MCIYIFLVSFFFSLVISLSLPFPYNLTPFHSKSRTDSLSRPTVIMSNHGSPRYEHETDMDVASCCGFRGCFMFFGSSYRKSDDNVCEHLVQQEGRGRNKETTWWRKKLNEAKEYTEVLGGPKWKNFIRKIGGYCERQKNRLCRKTNAAFPYDIHSYALNFDEGVAREEADAVLGFTARFAAPFSNEHGSMGGPVHGTDESAFVKSRG